MTQSKLWNQKTLAFLILTLGLVILVARMSNFMDGDLGWHLRFGQTLWQGQFPYTDTATYTNFGQNWINHEWGGDLLYWPIYSWFGYLGIVILTALALIAAFYLLTNYYAKQSPLTNALVILFVIWFLDFIIVARLAMLSAVFLAALIIILEKSLDSSKWLWFIIPLIWAWSALHGSWILGFIVMIIFAGGITLNFLTSKFLPDWSGKLILLPAHYQKYYLAAIILGALTICANPYGINIWREVLSYFNINEFKTFISEWMPSYTYPVFFVPLALAAGALVFIGWGMKLKQVSWPQALIFLAFSYAGWNYKRNLLYLGLLCAPIYAVIFTMVYEKLKTCITIKPAITKLLTRLFVLLLLTSIIIFIGRINLARDIFTAPLTQQRLHFPTAAVKFLKTQPPADLKIFNEFWWGGYLIWTLPDAKIYLDGRGTATWRAADGEFWLNKYRDIKYDANGLNKIESSPARYIILDKNFSGYIRPTFLNKIIFPHAELNKLLRPEAPPLVVALRQSQDWQLVFEDNTALVWQKLTP